MNNGYGLKVCGYIILQKKDQKHLRKKETYDYKNDMSNRRARTNILFTIIYNKFE